MIFCAGRQITSKGNRRVTNIGGLSETHMQVPIRKSFTITALLVILLSSGCQGGQTGATPVPSETSLPLPLIETTVPPTEEMVVSVPRGTPPVIDGTFSPGEWEQAAVESLPDGSTLSFLHIDGYLYLGLRGDTTEMIVGNVLLARGETIAILHASAALGTGVYRQETATWRLARGFVWRCRDTGASQAAQDERAAFLREEGWVATNSRIGTPNELEYQIEITGEPLRMTVNYIKASETEVKIPWPEGLEDGSVEPTPGGLPEQLDFSPERWARIEFLP
jgi:hypothetical protein